jgi:hypothetical protein
MRTIAAAVCMVSVLVGLTQDATTVAARTGDRSGEDVPSLPPRGSIQHGGTRGRRSRRLELQRWTGHARVDREAPRDLGDGLSSEKRRRVVAHARRRLRALPARTRSAEGGSARLRVHAARRAPSLRSRTRLRTGGRRRDRRPRSPREDRVGRKEPLQGLPSTVVAAETSVPTTVA